MDAPRCRNPNLSKRPAAFRAVLLLVLASSVTGLAGQETGADTAALAELEAKREQLMLRAKDARSQAAEKAESPDASSDPLAQQEIQALLRTAAQAECHARGKDLAIAELEFAAGVNLAATRIEALAPRVEACIANGEAAGEVRFGTAQGGWVHGRLYGTGTHGVVLAHGGRFTKESWAVQARALEAAGLRVLAIDFRGRGRSRAPSDAPPDTEYLDVMAAINYLHHTGSTAVSLVGASFGGAAAAGAAVRAEPGVIDAVVLLAPSVIRDPSAMRGRKLFLVAEDDVRGGGVRRLDEIRVMFEATPGPKHLEVLPGDAHAQFLFDTDQGPLVLAMIRDFLLGEGVALEGPGFP